jgi:hypothetical protein
MASAAPWPSLLIFLSPPSSPGAFSRMLTTGQPLGSGGVLGLRALVGSRKMARLRTI